MPEITNLRISTLKHYEKNPRKISKDQFEKLKNNMLKDPEFLSRRPILVTQMEDGTNIVYAGNQRLRAAKKLGWKELPCIVDICLSEAQIKDRVILDNLHNGEFDYDILAADYEPLALLELGFSERDLGLIEEIASNQVEEDQEVLEPGKDSDAVTKLGDVYELNGHRLVCGDSTLPEYVDKCLNGGVPILMVTDPPYGVEYDPSWRKDIKGKHGVAARAMGTVQNDGQVNWSLAWFLFPGSIAYVWHAGKYCAEVEKSLTDVDYEIISQIVWVKQHFALSRGDYHWQHEPCWYAVKKGQSHNWQGARDQATTWQISNLNCFGKSQKDGEERTAHSTQKPIECMARPIINNTLVGEGVYDPFLGSGTTLLAAEQLDRVCFGIELSPAYCDIIVNRWVKWMEQKGKKYTVKLNGEAV